ncbi:MAG: Tetratricopeptide repeat, partial [Planctomycetota bacterium]
MRRRLTVLVALLATAACGNLAHDLPHAPLRDLPWGDGPADRAAFAARAAYERGDARTAQAHLAEALAADPNHVDALRVRQDLLRTRGRSGVLWVEAERALAKNPEDPVAHYLAGRLHGTYAAREAHFRAAVSAAPHSLWPWFGLAHTLRDVATDRSLAIYAALYAASDQHPMVAVSYAAVALRADRPEQALAIYERLRSEARLPGLGDLGAAQALLALDRRDEAWTALLAALRGRPWDPGVHSLVAAWLESGASLEQERQVLDALREGADAEAALAAAAGGLPTLAELLLRGMRPQRAMARLEAGAAAARQPALRRLQRRLALALGEFEGFARILAEDVPRGWIDVPGNRVREPWLRLLDGPWAQAGWRPDGDGVLALARALLAVGWLVEAELVADWGIRKTPAVAEPLAELRAEASRELAFEAELRRTLYRGYRNAEAPPLQAVLDTLREVSQRIFGHDVVGEQPTLALPLVGELVDPFRGGLVEHLARYNRHLVLGRRSGGRPEGMLFTRYSLTELDADPAQPVPTPAYELLVADRDVRALSGVLGGDVAGLALLNHYLVDCDAVRDWARSLEDRRRIVREDAGAALTDPLPEDAAEEPVDVSWRLTMAAPEAGDLLERAVLDTIRAHERRHLVDASMYLPFSSHAWRAIALVFEFGFSPAAIEAEMERRAELAALALTPHTAIVLAHIADFAAEPDLDSPHHRGFGLLARQLHQEL